MTANTLSLTTQVIQVRSRPSLRERANWPVPLKGVDLWWKWRNKCGGVVFFIS
jgi:hypothetical protein